MSEAFNSEKYITYVGTFIAVGLIAAAVAGMTTCASFGRDMERRCMDKGGSYSTMHGCYQPMGN